MRSTLLACACAATVSMALAAPPVAAGPRLTVHLRLAPAAIAMAVDAHGRAYTVTNDEHPRRSHAVLRAFAADGSLRWERIWRPQDASVYAVDLAVSPVGTVAVTGRIKAAHPTTPCDEIWSYGWAVRTWRPDGNTLWQRSQPGWRTCKVFGTSGRAVAIGGGSVAIAAQHADEYSGSIDLIAFDLHGHDRWTRPVRVPGSQDEVAGDLAVGAGGSVFLAATSGHLFMSVEPDDENATLVKYRADGSLAWLRLVPDDAHGPGPDRDRGTSVALLPHGVVLGSLMDEPSGATRARIAAYGFGGGPRWEHRFPAGYHYNDVFVASWHRGAILANTEPDADGTGSHVVLRGFDGAAHLRWRLRPGPNSDASWGPTDLDAAGDAIAVTGRPFGTERWCRLWVYRAV